MGSQPKTWGEFWIQFDGPLSANARKLSDNADSWPDLLQETLVRLLSSSRDFQYVQTPLAYAFRALKNTRIDEIRRTKRALQKSLDDPNDVELQNELSYQPTMQSELEQKELLGTIKEKSARLTARLSDRERELLDHLSSGKTIAEIAEIFNEDLRITQTVWGALRAKLRYRATHWK